MKLVKLCCGIVSLWCQVKCCLSESRNIAKSYMKCARTLNLYVAYVKFYTYASPHDVVVVDDGRGRRDEARRDHRVAAHRGRGRGHRAAAHRGRRGVDRR